MTSVPDEPSAMRVLEFTATSGVSIAAADGGFLNSPENVRAYLASGIEGSVFTSIVLVSKKHLFGDRAFPAVCPSPGSALAHLEMLAKAAIAGFELVLGSPIRIDDIVDSLQKRGYAKATVTWEEVVLAAAEGERLSDARSLVERLGARTAICFGHDADPVYVVDLEQRA